VEEIGRAAADLLIRRSTGELDGEDLIRKVLPYELVFGNSVRKL